jgi:hypothetical protein
MLNKNKIKYKFKYNPPWFTYTNFKEFTTESSSKYISPDKQVQEKLKKREIYVFSE